MNLARLAPQPQMRAAKERIERRDTTSFLCVPCVLLRPILRQENKDLRSCSTDEKQRLTRIARISANLRQAAFFIRDHSRNSRRVRFHFPSVFIRVHLWFLFCAFILTARSG